MTEISISSASAEYSHFLHHRDKVTFQGDFEFIKTYRYSRGLYVHCTLYALEVAVKGLRHTTLTFTSSTVDRLKSNLNMFRVILLFSLVLSCSAFFSTSTFRQRVGASSLLMGNLIDNFRFVKHYNRFTFKTLYKCVVAAGLEETLAGPGPFTGSTFFVQRVIITHPTSVFRCIHLLPLLLSVFAPTDAAFAELP